MTLESSNIDIDFFDLGLLQPSMSGRLSKASLIESSESSSVASLRERVVFFVLLAALDVELAPKNLLFLGDMSRISVSSQSLGFFDGRVGASCRVEAVTAGVAFAAC